MTPPSLPTNCRQVLPPERGQSGDGLWDGERFIKARKAFNLTPGQFVVRRCAIETVAMFDEESFSPRLEWLRKHDLITRQLTHPYAGPQDQPWICCRPSMTVVVHGATEDECVWAWCRGFGVEHYSAESWERAMSVVPGPKWEVVE